jgi:hypothetical protein
LSEEIRDTRKELEDLIKGQLEKLVGSPEKEYFICDRLNDSTSFLSVFRDALYNYVDGTILIERFYHESSVENEEREVPKITPENEELIRNVIHKLKSSEIMSDEEKMGINDSLKSIGTEKVVHPVVDDKPSGRKSLVINIKDIGEEFFIRSYPEILANFIMSFSSTMFFVPPEKLGITLEVYERESYTDFLARIYLY